MNSLFDEDMPILNNNQELREFKKLFDLDKVDEYFLASGTDINRRNFLTELYEKTKQFIDTKGISQSRVDFGGFVWEIYIFNLLQELGLELESKDSGPDAIITQPDRFYVECISIAEDKDIKIPGNGQVINVDQDQLLVKLTGALWNKKRQRDEFIQKGRIDGSLPYIVAINSGALRLPQKYLKYPLILQGLIGIHHKYFTVYGHSGYHFRDTLHRDGKEIPLKPFLDGSYEGISGVIFCDTNVISLRNQPEELYFIPNPTCKNPIDINVFKPLNNIRVNKSGVSFTNKKYILIDLVNTLYSPKLGIDDKIKEIIDKYDAEVVIVTNATKDKLNEIGKLPYQIFTLEGKPRKEDNNYFKVLMGNFVLDPSDILYIEHNQEVVKLAKSMEIKTLHYDKDKKDYAAVDEFLKINLEVKVS